MWDFDRLAGRATHAQIVHDAGRTADAEPLLNARFRENARHGRVNTT
jgi:hypothetical protein